MYLRTTLDSNWRFSPLGYNSTDFLIRFVSFCHPLISLPCTRSLRVRHRCHLRHLPNIRRKDRTNIDGSLGLLALALRWYRWKVLLSSAAKPYSSFPIISASSDICALSPTMTVCRPKKSFYGVTWLVQCHVKFMTKKK